MIPGTKKSKLNFVAALFIIQIGITICISLFDLKLFNVGKEAIKKVHSHQFEEAGDIITSGDKYYNIVKYLNHICIFQNGFNNYVNSSYTVKGILALKNNDIDLAKSHLISSSMMDSSPALMSFGPNMSLAHELLLINESDIVLTYLENCRSFWKDERGKIEDWRQLINDGVVPDFGGNLLY